MADSSLALAKTDTSESTSLREVPYNLEAEQAVIGAILTNNEALNQVSHLLTPDKFYAPIHQRIYAAIQRFYDKGLIANPVTLKHHFANDDSVEDGYLATLVAAASSIINISSYSQIIIDLSLKRQLIQVGEELVNDAYDREAEASGIEQIEVAEQQLFHLSSTGATQGGFAPIKSALSEAIASAERAYQSDGDVTGVPTKLKDLDAKLGGLQRSDLLILAGRPSMGKTALATCIAFNAAKAMAAEDEHNPEEKPRSVGFFSLEMSAEQLANRMLASACNVNSNKLQRGDMTSEEFADMVRISHELSTLPFHIDDTPALSIAAVRTRARRLKRVHNLGLLVVDYLQLLRGTSKHSQQNRVLEISEITMGLKAIAKELDIPVVALSQLSRNVESREDKRPLLSDLRESGSIEQDADVVMFVYREEYYLSRTEPKPDTAEHAAWMEKMEGAHGLADVIIAKQRHGPIGTVPLSFQSDLTRFEDLARDEYLPESHY